MIQFFSDAVLVMSPIIDEFAAALAQPEDEFTCDATVRRFTATFDSACHAIVSLSNLERDPIPDDFQLCLERALHRGWLSDKTQSLAMVQDRLAARGCYTESDTAMLYDRIFAYYQPLLHLHACLLAEVDRWDTQEAPASEIPLNVALHRETIARGFIRHNKRTHQVRWNRETREAYLFSKGQKKKLLIGSAETMPEALDLALVWFFKNA